METAGWSMSPELKRLFSEQQARIAALLQSLRKARG
jgi:hypothetical protein